jgi:hypothetical protein
MGVKKERGGAVSPAAAAGDKEAEVEGVLRRRVGVHDLGHGTTRRATGLGCASGAFYGPCPGATIALPLLGVRIRPLAFRHARGDCPGNIRRSLDAHGADHNMDRLTLSARVANATMFGVIRRSSRSPVRRGRLTGVSMPEGRARRGWGVAHDANCGRVPQRPPRAVHFGLHAQLDRTEAGKSRVADPLKQLVRPCNSAWPLCPLSAGKSVRTHSRGVRPDPAFRGR